MHFYFFREAVLRLIPQALCFATLHDCIMECSVRGLSGSVSTPPSPCESIDFSSSRPVCSCPRGRCDQIVEGYGLCAYLRIEPR